jgi:hypothetical protein
MVGKTISHDLSIPIADALGPAHAKGIIRRGIKPGNIFFVCPSLQFRFSSFDFRFSDRRLTHACSTIPRARQY